MNINTFSLYEADSAVVEYETGEATVKIKTPDHEEGFGLLMKNTSASDATIKIKGGNSVLSVGDMIVSAAEGETLINLKNTGRYKNVSGENAGYIVIEISGTAPENISLFAFEL